MAELSVFAPVAQDPFAFADLSFPELQAPPIDENFAFEEFDLDDLDLDVDFDLDLFATDGQLSEPPPLATSSSSAASPEGGSSSSGAGGDGELRNEVSSESSSRSATAKDSQKGKGDGSEEDEAKRRARLVRNRDSAHLSRQRKIQPVMAPKTIASYGFQRRDPTLLAGGGGGVQSEQQRKSQWVASLDVLCAFTVRASTSNQQQPPP